MSHIRNLLYRQFGHEPNPLPVSEVVSFTEAPPERTSGRSAAAATAAVAPPALDFPVVEAHFGPENRLVFHTNPRSTAADRFRLLRMRLKEHANAGKLKKLLVTGPLAHDGKSTVVLNLATALAERGKRTVLVIEADLHHSTLAETLKITPCAGLAESLTDATSPLSAIRRIEPLGLYLIQAGEPRRNPTELLQTPAFGNIIHALEPHFDWILIDSPPVVPLTDALSIQQHADGTLLVVRAESTPRDAVDQSIALLGKKNIVGIVLNGVEVRDSHYYRYYGQSRNEED